MNGNYIPHNDGDDIGTDPTLVASIDTLDAMPEVNNAQMPNPNNEVVEEIESLDGPILPNTVTLDVNSKPVNNKNKKPDKKDLIKKILFVVIIVLLMAGVAFGLYYYLSLGKKGKTGKSKFKLDSFIIEVGDTLSKNVIDYGDFSTVDISECILNTMDVDVNTPGTYPYSVTCGDVKSTSSIIVKSKVEFNIEANLVIKEKNSELKIEEFVKSDKSHTYSYADEETTNGYLTNTGGPYSIVINATDESGNTEEVYAALYVIDTKPSMYLTCESPILTTNDSLKYSIIDKIAFNTNRDNMNISTRMHTFTYDDDVKYKEALGKIESGRIKIDSVDGIPLSDSTNKKIRIINTLSTAVLSNEYGKTFPSKYGEINNYYRNTKKYTCSI